jgi:hypothetical protein
MPNNSTWQGMVLGLADNGITYKLEGQGWKPLIEPISLSRIGNERAVD